MPRALLAVMCFGLLALLACLDARLPAQEAKPAIEPAALAKAEELVRSIFKEEYARAKDDRPARRELASTLLKQAREIEEEKAVRFVALREARDLAARAADTETAFQAVQELLKEQPGDLLAAKGKVLADAVAALPVPEGKDPQPDAAALAEVALGLATAAADAEDFDRAVPFGKLAEEAARKANIPALAADLGKRNERFGSLQKETARVRPAVDRLKADPADAAANLEVGRYWAFFRGSFLRGLPHLAKSGDGALGEAARLDLKRPGEAAEQVAVADRWLALAGKEEGAARTQMLARAYKWYQQALFRLEPAARRQVEARLEELRKSLPAELRAVDVAAEVRRLDGHAGEVLAAALSPSGRHALSGGSDRTVRLWDVATGEQVRTFAGHTGAVYGVAFSPDGKTAASCGEDRSVRLWDVDTGKLLHKLESHTDVVNNVAFAPDGKSAASASDDRTVRLWDVAGGKELRKIDGGRHAVFTVAFAPSGARLAFAGTDQTVKLWSADGAKELGRLEGHTDQVLSVAFSPDGRRLLSTSGDQTIRLWDLDLGKEVRRFTGHTASVGSAAFAPDGLRFLSASDDRTLRLWDAETGKELRQLAGHTNAVYRVVFSPDGRHALSASLDRTLRLWGPPR